MGNLCGKEAGPDPLAENARPLGQGASAARATTSAPPRRVGGPARTLGAEAGGPVNPEDARKKAAEAAEARAKAASGAPRGKLGNQLQEQKKQKRVDTLNETSRDELRARDADAAAQTRAYN